LRALAPANLGDSGDAFLGPQSWEGGKDCKPCGGLNSGGSVEFQLSDLQGAAEFWDLPCGSPNSCVWGEQEPFNCSCLFFHPPSIRPPIHPSLHPSTHSSIHIPVPSSPSPRPRASVSLSAPGVVALTSLSGCGTLGESGVAAWGPAGVGRASVSAVLGVRALVGGRPAAWLRFPAAVLSRADKRRLPCRCGSRQPSPAPWASLELRSHLPLPTCWRPLFLPPAAPSNPRDTLKPNNGSVHSHINVYSLSPGPSL
jgi:hypothetical protein